MNNNDLILDYLRGSKTSCTAIEIAEQLGMKHTSASPGCSDLYYMGWLDREDTHGTYHYRARATKAPARAKSGIKHPGRGRRRAPTQEAVVSIKLKGVDFSLEEALEAYATLGRLFERITSPKA
jgi:hypothetical protein